MRRILFAGAISLIATIAFPQFYSPDSIKSLLAKNTTPDSARVLLLIQFANAMLYTTPDSMMKYADEALSISKKINWQQGIARSLQVKGVAYSYVMNDQLAALDYYHQALDANKNSSNKGLEYNVIANIGVILYNQKQYDEALKYYKKALSILNGLENKKNEEQLLLNIANVYYDKHEFDTAKFYFQKSLDMAEKKGNILITIGALNALSYFYIQAKDYPKAQPYIEKSLSLSNQTGNLLTKANGLVNMALVKLYTHQTDSAEKYAKEALTVAGQVNSMQFRREAWDALSTIYEKKNQYHEAFAAAKNFNILNDSLLSDQSKQEITRLQLQYEHDEKEGVLRAEYAAKIRQQQITRNFLTGGAVLIILASCLIFFYYKRQRDAESTRKETEFRAEVTDTEMKALRSQMNPHFIFNSLNSISDYISKNDTKSADLYLTRFAKVMRMILENSEQKEVTLKDDLKALELYMQLESMRMNNKFTYEIMIDESIDVENTLVPPLILQPFVENSIWHGLSAKDGKGHILIQIKKEAKMINCIVEDNGIGRNQSEEYSQIRANKKSLGMKITKARIDIINKLKNSNAAVNISDLSEGMRAEVKLPLQLSF